MSGVSGTSFSGSGGSSSSGGGLPSCNERLAGQRYSICNPGVAIQVTTGRGSRYSVRGSIQTTPGQRLTGTRFGLDNATISPQ